MQAVGTPAKAPADMGGKGLKLANNIVTGLPAGMGVPVSASPAAQGGAVALDDYDKGAILDVRGQREAVGKALLWVTPCAC